MIGSRRTVAPDPLPPLPPPPSPANVDARSRRVKNAVAVAILVMVAALILWFLWQVGSAMSLPTTSEKVVREDLAALRPAGATIVEGPTAHSWDCSDGPAEAEMTLRFRGGRDHAELELRRSASAAGWLVDTPAESHRFGADLASFYRSRPVDRSDSFSVDFSEHGSFTDAHVVTSGMLGGKCGVD